MKFYRIKGILQQEYFLSIHSLEIFVDIVLYPLMSIIVFGFISVYIAGSNKSIANNVLMGIFLWQIISISQYTVTMLSMWNVWARNLSNLFITPLTIEEFLLASIISSTIKSLVVFIFGAIITSLVFHFDVLSLGIVNLFIISINLILFAFSIGIMILGLIFRYGSRIQALAWGLVPFFQPLTAAFYPIEILPKFLQIPAYFFPPTYAFEAARYSFIHHEINWSLLGISFLENSIYITLAWIFFKKMYISSRKSGQFAKNEG